MGTVGLGGSFSGLDWWSPTSSFASESTSPTYSTTGDSILIQNNTSVFPIGSTNSGGTIHSMCWANTSTAGTLFIGGSFSQLGSIQTANIGAYDLAIDAFKSVSPGLSGPVTTLYCDNTHGNVWVGGDFPGPNGSGSNVALWSTAASSWQAVGFGGLNGPVDYIGPSLTPGNIYFGGAFTTSYASNTSNLTSTPSMPYATNNTQTVGNSGYLTPATLPPQSTSAGNLTVTAGPSTNQSQYNDPAVMLCPGSGTWLGQDGQVAQVDVLAYSDWQATGIRISNALIQGRGTTDFW